MQLHEEFLWYIGWVCSRLLHCQIADVRVRRCRRRPDVFICNGNGWLAIVYVRFRRRRRRSHIVFFPPVRA